MRRLLQLGYEHTNQLHVDTVEDNAMERLCIGSAPYGRQTAENGLCIDREDAKHLVRTIVEHFNLRVTRGETTIE